MIIVTLSNWRRKVKILIAAVLVGAILGSGYILFDTLTQGVAGRAENDRDARGSLKVDAPPSSEPESGEEDLVETFMETLKTFCRQ